MLISSLEIKNVVPFLKSFFHSPWSQLVVKLEAKLIFQPNLERGLLPSRNEIRSPHWLPVLLWPMRSRWWAERYLTKAVAASRKLMRAWFSSSDRAVPCIKILLPVMLWKRCCFSCHASSDRSRACRDPSIRVWLTNYSTIAIFQLWLFLIRFLLIGFYIVSLADYGFILIAI